MNGIIRVFPRRTSFTPNDDYVFIGEPPLKFMLPDKVKKIMISVTFTWDIPKGYSLLHSWKQAFPYLCENQIQLGGVAFTSYNGEFHSGMFVKKGIVFTSRGCSRGCSFCLVKKISPRSITLPVKEGNNIADDNFLATPKEHQIKVFKMLEKQKAIEFSGGLDAILFNEWHVEQLSRLSISQLFFAYDNESYRQRDSLDNVAKLLENWPRDKKRIYVLCGYQLNDNEDKAFKRIKDMWELGFLPFAMIYRNAENKSNEQWKRFGRQFTRPAIIKSIFGKTLNEKEEKEKEENDNF